MSHCVRRLIKNKKQQSVTNRQTQVSLVTCDVNKCSQKIVLKNIDCIFQNQYLQHMDKTADRFHKQDPFSYRINAKSKIKKTICRLLNSFLVDIFQAISINTKNYEKTCYPEIISCLFVMLHCLLKICNVRFVDLGNCLKNNDTS